MIGMYSRKAKLAKPMSWKEFYIWHSIMALPVLIAIIVAYCTGCAFSQPKFDPNRPIKANLKEPAKASVQTPVQTPEFLKTDRKWYQGISFDTGLGIRGEAYPYAGLTIPFSIFSVSGGTWTSTEGNLGWYLSTGYSWRPFE